LFVVIVRAVDRPLTKEENEMQYFTTLFDREDPDVVPGSPGWRASLPGYERFAEVAGAAIIGGGALHPTSRAFTVRPGESEGALVADGPFAETAEVVGGFYVLEADSLDDAIELAKEIPVASRPHGAVELRPIVMLWSPETPVTTGPGDTRYLATIYSRESKADIPDTPEWDEGAAQHGQFIEKHTDSLLNGVAVHPIATATTVRVRDGETLIIDGPFAETAEVMGGGYTLRAASRDEAVAVAQHIPTSPRGVIELRPIVELD
jgi:hypothetical protein